MNISEARIIKAADGTEEPISPKAADGLFELEELQAAVGGYVEVHPIGYLPNGTQMLMCMNEEGKLKDLPVNGEATVIWWTYCGGPADSIFGDVLICRGDQL